MATTTAAPPAEICPGCRQPSYITGWHRDPASDLVLGFCAECSEHRCRITGQRRAFYQGHRAYRWL